MAIKACLALITLLLTGCAQRAPGLTVAAASNLSPAFEEAGAEFTQQTGIPVVFSYAATAVLARQVSESAPFDVFAAADTIHLDQLVEAGYIESRAIFARGQLALWVPGSAAPALEDLAKPEIRFVSIAQPELAPYGAAAVEALKAAGLWEAVRPKLVYTSNINQAKQLAASGNADAAFTAYSLVMRESGAVVRVHGSIEQAIGIVARSPHREAAVRFTEFVLSRRGQEILARNGYLAP